MWQGPHHNPWSMGNRGSRVWASDGMTERGTGHRGVAKESEQGKMAESAKQQSRGIGKPVAMG